MGKMTLSEAGRLGALKTAEYHHKQKELRIQEYNKNPSICKFCNKPLPYEKRYSKFCNHSCATSFNNKITKTKYKDKNYCINCGKEISVHSKYCSNKCLGQYKIKQKFQKIEETGYFPYNKRINDTNRKVVRQYLIAKYGHRCSICGLTEWMGKPIPLVADHIDGDATNHKVENFRMVCENCNAQLPTYKSKNKKGRTWRKKYSQL